MKSSDLNIGNTVKKRNGTIIQCDLSHIYQLQLWENTKYDKDPPVSPVKLTGQHLLNEGFELTKKDHYSLRAYRKGLLVIRSDGANENHQTFFIVIDNEKACYFEYVHQFENLLKLLILDIR